MAKEIKKAKVITPDQIRTMMTEQKTPPEIRQRMDQMSKENQALAMLMQKRESFAINILVSFIKGNAFAYPKEQDKQSFLDLVDLSVEMADHLMEKLYPLKEDK